MHSLSTIPDRSRVYIYGTGTAGEAMLAWLGVCRPDVRILGFLDSRRGGRLRGYAVRIVGDEWRPAADQFDLIVIASTFNAEITRHLEALGITRHTAPSIPTYLLKEVLPYTPRERLLRLAIRAVSALFPRPNHLFFGEHRGKFIGNNKYYFLHLLHQRREPVFWMVDDDAIHQALREAGLPVLHFRSIAGITALLRAGHLYFDNTTWQRTHPWLRHLRGKIIHMSHGVGLKITEKMQIPDEFMERLTPDQARRLNDRIFRNDLLISTSEFYAREVSVPAYNTPRERVTLSGYPKNDLFYGDILGAELFADGATLSRIDRHRAAGGRVIVYAPTFRDMEGAFRFAAAVNYPRLDAFLGEHNLMLIIKGHSKALSSRAGLDDHSDSIHIYDNDRDGYPLLKRADLLITDYSSIYMDYLHSGRPVLFFPFDYDDYTRVHRNLQFDYNTMTPGPKAYDQEQLIGWIDHFLLKGEDGYEEQRRHIFQLAYAHADGHSRDRVEAAIAHIEPPSS